MCEVRKMAGAVFAVRRRSGARHVLREDVARRNSFDEQRADIANHRREPIVRLQRGSRTNRDRLLAEARIKPTDDFALPEEAFEARFELAIELEKVIKLALPLGG